MMRPHKSSEDKTNIKNANNALGLTLETIHQSSQQTAFCANRCSTLDHLPLIGEVMDKTGFLSAYQRLAYGDQREDYPDADYLPLSYCTGFGSKGLASAFIAAEQIASSLSQTALPLTKTLTQAIHPHRFWVRQLKRINS